MSRSKLSDIISRFTDSTAESAGVRKKNARCTALTNVMQVPLDRLIPDESQPRKEFDEETLYRMAGSLRSKGQLQPIVARYDDQADIFIIVHGECRWRAAQIANLPTLNVVLDESERDMLEVLEAQLVENLVRSDLAPIEQAQSYQQLMESRGWTSAQLADSLGVDRSAVSRALALLDLPEALQAKVNTGELKGATLRQAIRRRPTKSRKGKAFSRTLNVAGAKIVISFKRSEVSPAEISTALREALAVISRREEQVAA